MIGRQQAAEMPEPSVWPLRQVETTLYALIEAIGESVEPGEEKLVVAAAWHLLQSGKVKLLDGPAKHVSVPRMPV